MGIYVETRIETELETLWERTQRPAEHRRWDLRFTEIDYLPPDEPDRPQRFRYATRLLPGFVVSGTGVAAGERSRPDGTRTSALRFFSPHPLSLLAEGQGYWRYLPTEDGSCVPGGVPNGVRFLTGYDYRSRWGRFGRIADRVVFRPLMGWATAWSFDRLRLWCERGVRPERSRWHALAELAARSAAVAGAVRWAAHASWADADAGALSAVGAWPVAVVAVLAALLLPPSPVTPAARRCRRRPPGRGARTSPPALLAELEPS